MAVDTGLKYLDGDLYEMYRSLPEMAIGPLYPLSI
jgi:hypothetical protein